MSDSVDTFGIVVKYGDRGVTTPATVLSTNIKDVGDLPGLKGSKYDVSRISQAKKVKRGAPGWAEPTPMKLTLGMKASEVVTIIGLSQVEKKFLLEVPDGTATITCTWDGHISDVQPKGKSGDEISVDVTIECDDEPVWDDGVA